jgi:hypothetical protein
MTHGKNPEVEADSALVGEAKDLVARVRASLTSGDLAPTQRQRQAILGRVLAVGDDESAANALEILSYAKQSNSDS